MEVLTALFHFRKIAHEQVIALLMTDTPHGTQIQFVRVRMKIDRKIFLAEDFRRVDVVRNGDNGLVLNAGSAAEAVDNPRRYRREGVIMAQFALEEMPQDAVFRLVAELDFHVIVNPHDFFSRMRFQRPNRALVLIAVEINGDIIFLSMGNVAG